jgi:nuclear RNA export factor
LDGKEVGPSIRFDVGPEKTELPPWKKMFLCDVSGHDIAVRFIDDYFAIYDSDNRKDLLNAYHENAVFSLTSTYNQHITSKER